MMKLKRLVQGELFEVKKYTHGGARSPITLEERIVIKKLIDQGYSLTKIAFEIGRGKNTVIVEVRKNGFRDHYDPYEAHKKRETSRLEGNKKRSDSVKGKNFNPYVSMSQRIGNLEMQIEILTDSIKELVNGKDRKD